MQKNIEEKIKIELTPEEKKDIKKEVKEILKNQEPIPIIGKEEFTKEEKISNFFNKIEFLTLSDEQKEEVAIQVKTDSAGDKLYWIEIFLSSGIAALGLLQNSVAVVIGAMLIAPLLRPINGLSFSIARGGQKFFGVALKVLFLSVLASVFMGALITFFVGLNTQTPEIIARSSPNIIDFFIAIFSAIVAIMSLRFTRLGESIAGVAMAASLMPPLVVVGIQLVLLNYSSAWGAMMLFLTNLVAILIVGILFFWLYGFTPHIERLQSKMFHRLGFVIVSMIIIIIPLVLSFQQIKEENIIINKTQQYLESVIQQHIEKYEISEIQIKNIEKDKIELSAMIKIPEKIDLNGTFDLLGKELSEQFNRRVELDLEIVRIVNIISQ